MVIFFNCNLAEGSSSVKFMRLTDVCIIFMVTGFFAPPAKGGGAKTYKKPQKLYLTPAFTQYPFILVMHPSCRCV